MKIFAAIVKYVITPAGTLIGLVYGFDTYIIKRANTVVTPVKVEVSNFKEYTKAHQERVELELRMLRGETSEIKSLIIKQH